MASYKEEDIKAETANFWVLSVGDRGFEVYQTGVTASTRVACIGRGEGPRLGLDGAVAEMNRRQVQFERLQLCESMFFSLKRHGWTRASDKGGPPTLVATKAYSTAVGPRNAEVWLGDVLRAGNLCGYAKYDSEQRNVLESLWLPVKGFGSEETVSCFAALADDLVSRTYAANLARWNANEPPSRLGLDETGSAWKSIFTEQAAVMNSDCGELADAVRREQISVER
jgi:hypothetical protein